MKLQWGLGLALAVGAAGASLPVLPALAQAPAGACCTAPVQDFPKVGGNYGNQNYSSLGQINRSNIGRLGAAWRTDLEGGSTAQQQQSTVVAVDGVLYVETTQGKVFAVDGKTGKINWTYAPEYGVNIRRGVAVGGGKVFTNLAGQRAAALDQKTGKPVWERVLTDDGVHGTMRAAVTYYDGLVYIGTSNERRGVMLALDADTGKTVWKFYASPDPGEYGSDTWTGDSWRQAGGSPWMHPAIDPQLGLVYWAFGNTGGDAAAREGQNLFTNSLVALDAKTGKRRWHYQSVHHDIWDLDNVMAPVLADITVDGRARKAVVYGSKTGMYYILDRISGQPLKPIEERPVPQSPALKTWPTQPYATGQNVLSPCPPASGPGAPPPYYLVGCLFTPPVDQPMAHSPGIAGGPDWSALSFNPRTGLIYSPLGIVDAVYSLSDRFGYRPLGGARGGKILAYDPAAQKIVWQKDSPWALAHGNGILTTAGDLMFIGQPDGLLTALDIKDGRQIWSFQTGAGVNTSPIAYEVDGEQYVAVFAGGNVLLYGSQQGDHLWAFKIGGKLAPAVAPPKLSLRQPIDARPVDGSSAGNTVNLARLWTNGAVADKESMSQNSMAPQALRVPAGATVTFINPAGNASTHCATQFYEGLFNSGPLKPGQSFAYTFAKPGEYFYNDCGSPRTTGKVVVY